MFSHGQPASAAYSDAKLQKFNLRSLKAIDNSALFAKDAGTKKKGKRNSKAADEEMPSDEEEVETGDRWKPSKVNPHIMAFYAHGLAMSKSYQSALCKFRLLFG
jgi:hypothetical protein